MTWRHGTIGDLVVLQRGHDLTADEQKSGDIPVIGSAGPNGWHNTVKSRGPGVTIGRSGASIGVVTYVDRDYWPHNTCIYVTDFKGNDPRFVYYLLKTTNLALLNSGAAQPSLNRNFVYGVKIRFPLVHEQQRVAQILSCYDDFITNNKCRVALLEQSARLLFKEWFVHLRYPGHEHDRVVDGVPQGWSRRPLGEICTLRAGDVFKPQFQGQTTGDYPFIKVRDMNSRGNLVSITVAENWVTQGVRESQRLKPFPPRTSVFAKIGEALRQNRVRYLVMDTIIDNNLMGAIPKGDEANGLFLFCVLANYDLASHASGAAVPFLTSGVLSSVPILTPAGSLIKEFSALLQPILDQITVLGRQSTEAAKARDLLLPRLMDGRLSV